MPAELPSKEEAMEAWNGRTWRSPRQLQPRLLVGSWAFSSASSLMWSPFHQCITCRRTRQAQSFQRTDSGHPPRRSRQTPRRRPQPIAQQSEPPRRIRPASLQSAGRRIRECLIVCKDSGGVQCPPIVPGWHVGPTVQDISNPGWELTSVKHVRFNESTKRNLQRQTNSNFTASLVLSSGLSDSQSYSLSNALHGICSCDHPKTLDGSFSKFNGQPCSSCSVAISSGNNHYNDNLQAFEAPWSLSDIVGETRQFTQNTYTTDLGLNVGGLSIVENNSRYNQPLQINVGESRKHALFEVQCPKMNSRKENLDLLEGRSTKQFATSSNEPTRDEIFDKGLLCSEHEPVDQGIVLQEAMSSRSTINSQTDQGRTSAQRNKKGKKQQRKEMVDLRTLLIHCAQAVSVNNHTLASDILSIIRQHASTSRDDSQRLAFCLADCLEVRLAGTGSQLYRKLMAKRRNAVGILKVFHLCIEICPFLRAPYYFSNKTIIDVSKGKPRVHIIDFGICFGFQWPSLFEQLAKREGGPPKVRELQALSNPNQVFDQMNRVRMQDSDWLIMLACSIYLLNIREYHQNGKP
ncbi:hypothetical protein C2845_PM01G35700 [Panicum miliaceum]|uniref:Uncharacterized protein n=1 Tax=Panicum miliaceum TaxID=4540 RepID=A0A3L6TMC7_PANMI|nr:hypothetical protein C2845_PM01G35700 [Panicum miliaceum]